MANVLNYEDKKILISYNPHSKLIVVDDEKVPIQYNRIIFKNVSDENITISKIQVQCYNEVTTEQQNFTINAHSTKEFDFIVKPPCVYGSLENYRITLKLYDDTGALQDSHEFNTQIEATGITTDANQIKDILDNWLEKEGYITYDIVDYNTPFGDTKAVRIYNTYNNSEGVLKLSDKNAYAVVLFDTSIKYGKIWLYYNNVNIAFQNGHIYWNNCLRIIDKMKIYTSDTSYEHYLYLYGITIGSKP